MFYLHLRYRFLTLQINFKAAFFQLPFFKHYIIQNLEKITNYIIRIF
jgi:hypothetical protein